MEYRFLGNSGLKVSAISLGGWLTYGGVVQEDLSYECMKRAFELGINFFDNAEVYSHGDSELAFGKVFKRIGWKRSDYLVSTKVFWGGTTPNARGLSRKHIIEGATAALERMQLEYVDLIFAHRPDPYTPMEEIVRAFNHVLDRGWAFYWGTSEWSAQQITEAHLVARKLGLVPPLMEQPEYNMFKRDRFEDEYAPLYKTFGMGTTVWSPLGGGLLTGKYNESIPKEARMSKERKFHTENERLLVARIYGSIFDTEEGQQKIEKVRKLTEYAKKELGVPMAHLALAWTLKNPNVSTAIVGATKLQQIEDNVKALEVVPRLTDKVMRDIDGILKNKPSPAPDARAFFD